MSSINPVIVLPQALQARGEQIAGELAASVVMGCGQFCTNPGLVVGIRSPQFEHFVQTLAARMADQGPQTMLNAGTLRSYQSGVQHLLAHPVSSTWPGSHTPATRPSRSCSRQT